MPLHVRITAKDPRRRSRDALALDKDAAWLEEHILAPRRQGRDIFIDGQVFSWDAIDQIHITETDHTSDQLLPQIHARRLTEGVVTMIEDEWYVAYDGREVTEQHITGPPGADPHAGQSQSVVATDRTAVMVVYGQDSDANQAMFDWLRAIGLSPKEWGELVRASGSASPFIGQVLDKAFEDAQAVVVMFTPDEHVALREVLSGKSVDWSLQARPNVLFEAGMAFATHPDRTMLVVLGEQRLPSDLAGRHFLRLDGSPEALHDLAERLRRAGCQVNLTGNQWLRSRFPRRDDVLAAPSAPEQAPAGNETESPLLMEKLDRILQDLIAIVSTELGVAGRDLGAHVWRPTPDGDALERLRRVRVGDTPPNRPRRWRLGEGVVGCCWATGEDVYLDLQRTELRDLNPASFRQLPDDLRMELDFTALQRSQLDFRAIWATPVYRRDLALGVFSLNLDSGRHEDFGTQSPLDRLLAPPRELRVGRMLHSAAVRVELALP